MAASHGPSQEHESSAKQGPGRRTTKLFFDDRGLWRVISRLEGCFPDVNLTRRPNETEPRFRRRIAKIHNGILDG